MRLAPLIGRAQRPSGLPFQGSIVPYLDGTNDGDADGNGIIDVPAGVYSVGALGDVGTLVDVTNTRTAGNKRWVRAADGPGTVIVDLSYYGASTGLSWANDQDPTANAENLVIAGITFQNGTLWMNSVRNLFFYYCEFSRSPRSFYDEAIRSIDALGTPYSDRTASDRDPFATGRHIYGPGTGSPQSGLTEAQWLTVESGMASPHGPIRIAASNGACNTVQFIGCDIGPSCDDGMFVSGTWHLRVEGTRFYKITEWVSTGGDSVESVDPGHTLSEADWFHCDVIQLGINGYSPDILDCYIPGRIMWNEVPHPSAAEPDTWDMNIRRCWFGGERSIAGAGNGYSNGGVFSYADVTTQTNTLPGVVAAATTGNASKWGGTIRDNVYIGTGSSLMSYPQASSGNFTNLTLTNNTTEDGSGLSPQVDSVFNQDTLWAHVQNPALVWRAANAYSQTNLLAINA